MCEIWNVKFYITLKWLKRAIEKNLQLLFAAQIDFFIAIFKSNDHWNENQLWSHKSYQKIPIFDKAYD